MERETRAGASARFTFARGNAAKLLSAPLYALGTLASLVVPRRGDRWVFGSGSGLGEGALPLALHVRATDPGARVLWLAADERERQAALALGLPSALRSTWRGFRATLRAGVIVITHGFGDVNRFGTRGAFVVQLWHGIPLKKIQLDSPVTFTSSLAPAALLRTLYRRSAAAIDLLPAASETSAARLRTAFGLPAGRVVVTGDPRDDTVLRPDGARDLLESALGPLADSQVLLYAPTWRDGASDPGVPSASEWTAIADYLERSNSLLALRPHPHGIGDYERGTTVSPRIRMLPSRVVGDLNRVLPGVDVVITDYSSVAYDFALTARPIVFFARDVAEYVAARGLYEPYEEFSGGHTVSNWEGVIRQLDDAAALGGLREHSSRLAQRHHAYRDGRNTERVYTEIAARLRGQE